MTGVTAGSHTLEFQFSQGSHSDNTTYFTCVQISGSGTLPNVLPTATALSIGSGGTFDLNGTAQTVASLSDYGGSTGTVTNNSTAVAAFALSPTGGTATFSGSIQNGTGVLCLAMSGPGTQTLAGTRTYTGSTNVSAGALIVSGALGNGPVNVSGGSMTVAGSLGNGAVTVSGGAMSLTGTVGNGPLGVSGGILTDAGNLGSGTATVSGGTLQVNVPGASIPLVHLLGGTINGTGSLSSAAAVDLQSGTLGLNLTGGNGATKTTTGIVAITAGNTLSGAFNFTAASAGTVNVQAANGLGTTTVSLGQFNVLEISTPYSGVMGGAGTTLNETPGGIVQLGSATAGDSLFNLAAGQTLAINTAQSKWQTPGSPANPFQINVAAGALLDGNVSGATFGA